MDDFIYLIILAVLAVIGLPLAAIIVVVDTRKKMALMQTRIDRLGAGLHKLETADRASNIETVETLLPKSPVEPEIAPTAGLAALGTIGESGGLARLTPQPVLPWKKWLLWTLLILAAIVTARMALNLYREMNQSAPT